MPVLRVSSTCCRTKPPEYSENAKNFRATFWHVSEVAMVRSPETKNESRLFTSLQSLGAISQSPNFNQPDYNFVTCGCD